MRKSILTDKIKKGPGRPPKGPMVSARLPQGLIDKIDAWANRECDGSRSEAIRRLVERGLAADTATKPMALAAKAEPSVALPADPLAMVDAWAAANRLDRRQAVLALINAGIAAPTEPAHARKSAGGTNKTALRKKSRQRHS